MKKHILSLLSLFSILNSMDGPVVKAPQVIFPKHFDMWEFFSEPNNLDKLGEPVLVWNKKRIKDDCDINTLANLHILQKSNVQTKQKVVFDPVCSRGNIAAFLAQDAETVHGYDEDSNIIRQADKKYKLRNLTFWNNLFFRFRQSTYDLIVSCSPSADIEKLQHLRRLLKPQGEIFCLFSTRSNTEPIETQVVREILPKIQKCVFGFEQRHLQAWADEENKKYPMDGILQNMIAQSGFDIITFEQKNFNILIQDINAFKNFHKSLSMNNLPFMKLITYPKNREKIANLFIGKFISKLKKDESGNWIYPCSKTIVHIRKTE